MTHYSHRTHCEKMQLLEKAVELRGSQILNAESYQSIIIRRRIMAVALIICWVAVGLFIAALATSNWAIIDFQNTDVHNVHVQLGVWGEWRTVSNWSHTTKDWIPHFPSPPESVHRLADADLKHYYRAQAVIGCIGLFILLTNNLLAIYTFYHHRYMYKRVCACLYLVVAGCILVTIEVLTQSVDEWDKAVSYMAQHGDFDYDQHLTIGYSTRLAQSVVVICGLAFLAFIFGSHKQKGDHAATMDLEIEDRPVHIGRL